MEDDFRTADDVPELDGAPSQARMDFHFSARVLVRSELSLPDGTLLRTGVRNHEVRWQQGAIAVCILAVHTRICYLLGADEDRYFLSGERGSPARSLDNLLNRPGDWAFDMFGERDGLPGIRDYIYRRKTVSRSNPVSELSWDRSRLPPERLTIYSKGERCDDVAELAQLLRNLLEEFSPKTAEREWQRLFPEGLPVQSAEETGVEEEEVGSESTTDAPPAIDDVDADLDALGQLPDPSDAPEALPAMEEAKERAPSPVEVSSGPPGRQFDVYHRTQLVLIVVLVLGIILVAWKPWNYGSNRGTEAKAITRLEQFFEDLNNRDVDSAWMLLSSRYQESLSRQVFDQRFADIRFEDLRILGHPRNRQGAGKVLEFEVSATVVLDVRVITELFGISHLKLSQFSEYEQRVEQFLQKLALLNVPDECLDELEIQSLHRLDVARQLQRICGISDEDLSRVYPGVFPTQMVMHSRIFLVREQFSAWRIDGIEEESREILNY